MALPDAGYKYTADGAREAVIDVVDVAVAVCDGDAEALEEGRAPACFNVVSGLFRAGGGGGVETHYLEDDDGEEEDG